MPKRATGVNWSSVSLSDDFPHPVRVQKKDLPPGWTLPPRFSMTSDYEEEVHYNGTLVAVFGRDTRHNSYAQVLTDDPDCKRMVREAMERANRAREIREGAESRARQEERSRKDRELARDALRALKGDGG